MSDGAPFAIVGAGPAGLIAADVLSAAGKRVVVFDRMPSVARKFLMAGRGGLNLTHSEPFEYFLSRYGRAAAHLAPMLESFPPSALIEWAEGLGQETFIGSSGRVFPKAMKASPLLRAWLTRLQAQGVEIRTRMRWTGWDGAGALTFTHDNSRTESIPASATLLALGGASWPKLGADGAWASILRARGVEVTPFAPSNMGFEVNWSPKFSGRFAGEPLKQIAIRFGDRQVRGECIVSRYGLEGGLIYALSTPLRDAIAAGGPVTIYIDLKPQLPRVTVFSRVYRAQHSSETLATRLRKTLRLHPVAINLLYEVNAAALQKDAEALADLIKAVPVTLTAPRGLDRAISSAGGVAWDAVDENLQLRALPGVYVAGEMLDWEAPTGGYLLQASFASGVHAARAMLRR